MRAKQFCVLLEQQQNLEQILEPVKCISAPHPLQPSGLGCCPFFGGCSIVVDSLFIVALIVRRGVCIWSLFCYVELSVFAT